MPTAIRFITCKSKTTPSSPKLCSFECVVAVSFNGVAHDLKLRLFHPCFSNLWNISAISVDGSYIVCTVDNTYIVLSAGEYTALTTLMNEYFPFCHCIECADNDTDI